MSEQIFRRFMQTDLSVREDAGKKLINMIASTDAPVDMGGWREILVHQPGSVDHSSCRALLLNHKSGMIAGALREIKVAGGKCEISAEILDGAKCESGVSVSDAVASGALRGVSIGYTYAYDDCTRDEQNRIITVNKWSMREASLTPIPADTGASVRECPFTNKAKEATMPETPKADPVNDPVAKPKDCTREIVTAAESVGLRGSDYLNHETVEAAREAMFADLVKRQITTEPKAPAVTITADEGDKHRSAAIDALANKVIPGSAGEMNGNPYAGRRMLDVFTGLFAKNGLRNAHDMDRSDIARIVVGKRDAPGNISLASLASFVFLNQITKIVAKGVEMSEATTKYQRITEIQSVPDFKTYSLGGLGMQNLQKTAENVAFPELTNSEGVYSSTAKMWGGTISLSIQALVSDDTMAFERALRQAGAIANKTIDRRCFQKLLMGTSSAEGTSTWTSNTTSGCSPVWTTADTLAAARAKFQLGRVALSTKVGADGNPLGTIPRFIVCGPTSGVYLRGLNQTAPGQPVGSESYEIIETPWLEATALTGYSTTSFYLLADPMVATGLVLSNVMGFENVQVDEYDAGAVAARNWKLWRPFEVDLFYYTNKASTAIIPAAQQCTT